MSTKRLSKTISEHHGSSKSYKKILHSTERAYEREYCDKIKLDPESADEYDIASSDECYYGGRGGLNSKVLKRWLFAQIGRPWAEVRSEIFKKFDAKTVSKYDSLSHLLSYCVDEALSGWDRNGFISANKTDHYRGMSFYVDDDGLLRKHETSDYLSLPKKEILVEIGEWLNGRMVGENGGKLYWFAPMSGLWKAEYNDEVEYSGTNYFGTRKGRNSLKYFLWENSEHLQCDWVPPSWYGTGGYYLPPVKRFGFHWEWIENPFSFRQRGELFENEIKYFNLIPERVKSDILAHTKNRF
jgi:hypothetical protein